MLEVVHKVESSPLERAFSEARACLDFNMGASKPETIANRFFIKANRVISERILRRCPDILGLD
jgi:regulator of extracellular matrix RemA (YlzA/DUF370 family)